MAGGKLEDVVLDHVAAARRRVHEGYQARLLPLQQQGYLELPRTPEPCRSSYHMFYVLLPSEAERDALLRHLKQQGIQAAFHFVPLHDSPMGRRFRTFPARLSETERMAGRLLRLPFFDQLTDSQLDRVTEAIEQYFRSRVTAGG